MLGRAVAPAPKAQQTLGVVGLTSTSEEPHGLIIAGRPAAVRRQRRAREMAATVSDLPAS